MFAVVGAAALAAAALAAPSADAAPTPKPPKTVSFSSATFEVTEGAGTACVTVERSVTKGKAPVATVTTTTGGTATEGIDYTATTATARFARGATLGSVCAPILVDQVTGETDETVNLTLTSVTGRGWTLGTQTTATLTIHEMARTSAPRELTAELVSTVEVPYVHLAWFPPTDGTAATYVVLSGPSSIGPYTVLDTTEGTSYDVTPAPETDTYYLVEARNADGVDSDDSNQAFIEGFAPGAGLFWAAYSSATILTANPDGSGAHVLVPGDGGAFGVAVDSSHVYWADTGADAIMRSDLDGTNVTTLVSDVTDSHPYGVAVNATHVYWTDMQSQKIKRADLDGGNVTTLIDGTGQLQPAAIAIDGTYLYLGDVAGNGRIMRANLNGTGLTTLVNTDPYPFAIAVDSGHIYWATTGSNEGATGAIWRSELNGSSPATIATGQAHPAGIAVDSTHVYWTNANNGTINRSGLDGSGLTTLVSETSAWGGVAVQN